MFIQTVGIIREYHITTSSACFFTAYSVLVQHPWVNISHPNKAVYGVLFCLTQGCFLAAMCVRIVLNDFLVFSMARQSLCPWLCQLLSCLEHIKRMGSLVCVCLCVCESVMWGLNNKYRGQPIGSVYACIVYTQVCFCVQQACPPPQHGPRLCSSDILCISGE